MSCPLCATLRAERDEALEHVRQLKDAARIDDDMVEALRCLKLTPTQRRILALLLLRETTTTRSALNQALYGHRADGGPDECSVATVVCYLRGKLRPHGIAIATVWGSGWRMDAENKARVRELIGAAS